MWETRGESAVLGAEMDSAVQRPGRGKSAVPHEQRQREGRKRDKGRSGVHGRRPRRAWWQQRR